MIGAHGCLILLSCSYVFIFLILDQSMALAVHRCFLCTDTIGNLVFVECREYFGDCCKTSVVIQIVFKLNCALHLLGYYEFFILFLIHCCELKHFQLFWIELVYRHCSSFGTLTFRFQWIYLSFIYFCIVFIQNIRDIVLFDEKLLVDFLWLSGGLIA